MKKLFLIISFIAILTSGASLVAQESDGFKVIVNKSNPLSELPSDVVSKMFLRKETWWPDSTKMFVAPIERPDSSNIRRAFSDNIHQQSVSAIKKFWRMMILSGKDVPPDVVMADTTVIRYIGQITGGISYVAPETPLTDDVKELKILYDKIVRNEEKE